MSLNHVSNALNLLGQAAKPAASPVHLETGEGPKLEVAWSSFHQGIFSSIAAVLTWTRVPKNFLDGSFFKECWVERRIPRRAIFAAALWHIVFLVMPSPRLPAAATHFHEFDNTELTWSGPITDFPLVEMKAPKAKPTPRGELSSRRRFFRIFLMSCNSSNWPHRRVRAWKSARKRSPSCVRASFAESS